MVLRILFWNHERTDAVFGHSESRSRISKGPSVRFPYYTSKSGIPLYEDCPFAMRRSQPVMTWWTIAGDLAWGKKPRKHTLLIDWSNIWRGISGLFVLLTGHATDAVVILLWSGHHGLCSVDMQCTHQYIMPSYLPSHLLLHVNMICQLWQVGFRCAWGSQMQHWQLTPRWNPRPVSFILAD